MLKKFTAGPRGGGYGGRKLLRGARVKTHVLEKASLIPRENVSPATWRKRGPLGKGNY